MLSPAAQALTAAIDAALLPRVLEIVQAQQMYKGATGHFAQGGMTHSVIPADGEFTVPDLAGTPLPGRAVSWAQFGAFPTTMNHALRCDVYDGDAGDGYVLLVFARCEGLLLNRAINLGPELARDQAWHALRETI